MSYIDAKSKDGYVHVVERNEHNKRVIRKFKSPFTFYVEDPSGEDALTIHGEPAKLYKFNSRSDFNKAREELTSEGVNMYESDVRDVFKVLEENYADKPPSDLIIGTIDIEVDSLASRGWARYNNPYAPINAVTFHNSSTDEAHTLLLCPPTLSIKEAEDLVAHIPNTYVVDDEALILEALIELIIEVDVTTGWNSEFFDMPYIVQRIRHVLGQESFKKVAAGYNPSKPSLPWLRRLCRFGEQPTAKEVERFGGVEIVFDFPGIPHLDYLELYRKFTFVEQHSYKLDHILQVEVDQSKVAYEGTLEQLYRNDFKLFAEYNRQDVMGLVDLNKKLGFIDLANQMIHQSCVLFPQVLGSVSIIERAVTLELHKQGRVAPDKVPPEGKSIPVAGAFVFEPEGGLSEWISSYDVNSLYPSVIRALNISPETVVGQFDLTKTVAELERLEKSKEAESRTEAWHHFTGVIEYHDIFEDGDDLTMIAEGGDHITMSPLEWREFFSENDVCVTANGTVFRTDEQGIIPYCLEKWYNDRVEYKKKMKDAKTAGNDDEAGYWDRVQMVRKIFLNSLYGALLNSYFTFYDQRFGQSVTLSGRVITKHMAKKANELIIGDYDFGEVVIYGDTDSVAGDTIIETDRGEMTIEALFKSGLLFQSGSKERASCPDVKIKVFDPEKMTWDWGEFDHVYRHRVSKEKWLIEGEDGSKVYVTEDHSVMVKRDGNVIGVKPRDIREEDELISVNSDTDQCRHTEKNP